uniref:Aminotransferase class V domain-containing protein n=1 Tax=Pycnococcus provasolii TaxID=41880 RepID=A0A7S2F0G4_9CHLO|mmetsp:Transcript_11201/g.25298  ORF Transcript_11201/g.25298 Transcript_11201/m.25298 type:complete len:503 (+) Transcript_11201:651-2159(+)
MSSVLYTAMWRPLVNNSNALLTSSVAARYHFPSIAALSTRTFASSSASSSSASSASSSSSAASAAAASSSSSAGAASEYLCPEFSYTPPGKHHLFVPGPTNIPDSVQREMHRASLNHRDPFFKTVTYQALNDVKYLFKTHQGQPYVFPGTGTGAWEAGFTNTLSEGDKVIMFRYGQFSHLWVDMAQRLGLNVICLEEPWGNGADEAKLEQVLKEHPDTKAVCVVHNETTTGVTSDLPACRAAMDRAGSDALLMVDGVSSIGACEFKMDEWGVDIAVTGSQKALSLPTGLALVCASPKAKSKLASSNLKKVYYSFEDMDKFNAVGGFPYTPSIPLLYGLIEAMRLIKEEGLDNVIARHARFGEGTRAAAKAWGLETLCTQPRWYSNSLTVLKAPPEITDTSDFVTYMYCKYNVSLGLGLSEVQGKVFRIGHLGSMDEVSLLGAIAATEMGLRDYGALKNVSNGAGVGAALDYFRRTARMIPTRDHVVHDPMIQDNQTPMTASG